MPFLDALALAQRRFGPDHPHVAILLENFAALSRVTGREAIAVEAEHRAASIRGRKVNETIDPSSLFIRER